MKIDFNDVPARKPKFHHWKILGDAGIPKQMHNTNPRTLLGSAWWDKTRKAAYAENNYCCCACGVSNVRLEAHERYRYKVTLRGKVIVRMREVVALCNDCHSYIHRGRLQHLVATGQEPLVKYSRVVARGDALCKKHKVKYQHLDPRIEHADRSKFELRLGDQVFKPVFQTEEEWRAFYSA